MNNKLINDFNQFDVVRLLTVRNIRFVSGPAGRITSPQGEWSVVGFVDGEALLAKQTTIIRVPVTDITIVARYDLSQLSEQFKNVSNKIDMAISIANEFNITYNQAVALCKKHKIPLKVDSKVYEDKALQRVRKVRNGENNA